MGTHATISIKNADMQIYVHYDGYDLRAECDYICDALQNSYGTVRVEDDPEYASMRMVDALLKYMNETKRYYTGTGYGLRSNDTAEEYNYVIYSENGEVKWKCDELS